MKPSFERVLIRRKRLKASEVILRRIGGICIRRWDETEDFGELLALAAIAVIALVLITLGTFKAVEITFLPNVAIAQEVPHITTEKEMCDSALSGQQEVSGATHDQVVSYCKKHYHDKAPSPFAN